VWEAEPEAEALVLRHVSPAGHNGFPGTLRTEVRYAVESDAVTIDFSAVADAPTVVNLTNHAYFNLAARGDILDTILTIAGDGFTPVDEHGIPTGDILCVADTPFDFRTPHRIGERIEQDDPQLRVGRGYDHNFVLGDASSREPRFAARAEAAGLALEVWTTEPGLQFYSGNHLRGAPHPPRSGFCLETQHFPDSPNHPDFPSTVLRPGDVFTSRTVWRFACAP
jgi:aldose 1-epimerase